MEPINSKPEATPQRKNFLLPALIILLVIVAAGSGAYYFLGRRNIQPTPSQQTTKFSPSSTNETTNWKTYTNIKYSFSFKYPQALALSESGPSSPAGSTLKLLDNIHLDEPNDSSNNFPIMDLSIIDSQQSPTDYVNTSICIYGTCLPLQSGILPESVLVQTAADVHYQSIDTLFAHNNLLFDFSIGSRLANTPIPKQDAYKTYSQILSTFKFTNTSSTSTITILVPNDVAAYEKAITGYVNDGGQDPSKTWPFVKKTLSVPYTTDVVKASAEAAAEQLVPNGGPAKATVAYLKIQDSTAYVLLSIDVDGWAGVSFSIAKIHPLVEKTLLQFPQIQHVVFGTAPGDTWGAGIN